MSFILSHKRQVLTFLISVVLSVFLVAFMAGAVTYIDTDSVGIATSTPGGALGVKGAAIIDGLVHADYFTSTSTNTSWLLGGNFGLGTTTPGAKLGVRGAGLFESFVAADYFTSTSTGTSWLQGPFGLGTTTPGAKAGVKGAGLFEGFVSADYFTSTSTNTSWLLGGNFGLGTSTPGAKLGVRGAALVDGFLLADYFTATSSGSVFAGWGDGATSTTYGVGIGGFGSVKGNWNIDATSTASSFIATSTLTVGSTTPNMTFGGSDVPFVVSVANASTTIFIAGGAEVGGAIILKDSDGQGCTMITVNDGVINSGDVTCPSP